MPDGRLAYGKVEEADGLARITFALRFGAIHPALNRALWEFSRSYEDAPILDLDPGHPTQSPDFQAWFSLVDEKHTADGLMRPHITVASPQFAEILVRRGAADPALLRELNEEVMPLVCGLLVPVTYADQG